MSVHHSEDCGEVRKYEFRHIMGDKIKFQARAPRDVAVCLSKDDEKNDDMYEIFIGCWGGDYSGIRRGGEDDVIKIETPNILSEDDFRGFWIKLKRGVVKVGRKGEIMPFMQYADPHELLHVTWYGYSTGWGAEGDWIFPAIGYKRIARWVPGKTGFAPKNPVCGGLGEHGPVFVGMAHHEGGHILGMIVPGEGCCYIPYGGEAIPKEEYFVLSNPTAVEMEWAPGSCGKVPPGALEGGISEDGEKLYIGRVRVDGVASCGKIHPSHECCYVPYGGTEHSHKDYEVLCVKGVPLRSLV